MFDRNTPLPGPEVELHTLAVSGDSFLVAARFACYRGLLRCGFQAVVMPWAAVERWGPDPVVIAVDDLDIPARWEFRTSGLWAEQVCEQPGSHWSYGLEAFALQIDEPDELLRRGYGLRVPLGWELDFDVGSTGDGRDPALGSADGPEPSSSSDDGLVERVGTVDGVVLLGPDEYSITGPAVRTHLWGDQATVAERTADRTVVAPSTAGGGLDVVHPADHPVLLPTPIGIWTVSTGPS